jgi:hypothetical protein
LEKFEKILKCSKLNEGRMKSDEVVVAFLWFTKYWKVWEKKYGKKVEVRNKIRNQNGYGISINREEGRRKLQNNAKNPFWSDRTAISKQTMSVQFQGNLKAIAGRTLQ